MRHPDALWPNHIASFPSGLATEGHVSASTQNQALCAVLFLYRVVLGREVGAEPDCQPFVRGGLRLREALELRVKDLDLERGP